MSITAKLKKLLGIDKKPTADLLAEIMQAQSGMLGEIRENNIRTLDSIQKNSASISLQVEEIYDIIKEYDDNGKELKNAALREEKLLESLMSASDLTDDLLSFMQKDDESHAGIIAAKLAEIMDDCQLERLGIIGEPLNPRIHNVSSAEPSTAPAETVIQILQNGYAYNGKIIRKASVILSCGSEPAGTNQAGTDQTETSQTETDQPGHSPQF